MPAEKGYGTKSAKAGGTIPKSDSTSSATTAEPSTPEPATASTSATQPLLSGSSNPEEPPAKGDSLSRQVRGPNLTKIIY